MNTSNNILLLLLAFFLCFATYAQEENYIANQIIVKLKAAHNFSLNSDKTNFGLSELDILNQKHAFKKARSLQHAKTNRIFVLEFQNEKDIAEVIKDYTRSNLFEYVEPNYILYVTDHTNITSQNPPNDPHYPRQWALNNDGSFSGFGPAAVAGADINMELAWEIETGSESIIVAVLDTGISLEHPEFDGRIWENPNVDEDDGYLNDLNGWNFVEDNNMVADDQGHGTAVAGVVAANPNNNIGYAGVDWHCLIMPLKIINAQGEGTTAGLVEAIYYAVEHGANVINLSLGSPDFSSAEIDAIDFAVDNNVTTIAAMGNENSSEINYPAGYFSAIAIGSTESNDKRSDYLDGGSFLGSNYGDHIDVVAPGGYIYVLDYSDINNYEVVSSGTSLATPHVAGLASLLLAQDPTRSPEDIREIIRVSADDEVGRPNEDTEGFDIYHGYGRINAHAALTAYLSVADNEEEKVMLYPNPATEHFVIQNNNFTKLEVFSITGKLLLSKSISSESEITQSVNNWNSGVYILRLENEKGQSSTEKLVVRRN